VADKSFILEFEITTYSSAKDRVDNIIVDKKIMITVFIRRAPKMRIKTDFGCFVSETGTQILLQ
jgi:hypothetical protein